MKQILPEVNALCLVIKSSVALRNTDEYVLVVDRTDRYLIYTQSNSSLDKNYGAPSLKIDLCTKKARDFT